MEKITVRRENFLVLSHTHITISHQTSRESRQTRTRYPQTLPLIWVHIFIHIHILHNILLKFPFLSPSQCKLFVFSIFLFKRIYFPFSLPLCYTPYLDKLYKNDLQRLQTSVVLTFYDKYQEFCSPSIYIYISLILQLSLSDCGEMIFCIPFAFNTHFCLL